LHLACELNLIDEVQLLAEHEQTDVDFPDAQGNTPLHVACNFIHEPLILYLISGAQVNPEIKNLKAKIPLDMLKKRAG
jgi:ankyrin repeat protein